MNKFRAGDWIMSPGGLDLVYVHGYAMDGRMITESEDGTIEADCCDWSKWVVVPAGDQGFNFDPKTIAYPHYYICDGSKDLGPCVIVRESETEYRVEYPWGETIIRDHRNWARDCDRSIEDGAMRQCTESEAADFIRQCNGSPTVSIGPNRGRFIAAALTGLLANPNVVERKHDTGWGPCNTEWEGIVNMAKEIGALFGGASGSNQ